MLTVEKLNIFIPSAAEKGKQNICGHSGVASSKYRGGPKILWGPKCLTSGKQRHFVWDTASQSTK